MLTHPELLFQPSDFEAIVTVNVTSMLVLVTLFISVANSLPRTSYVKMIDIWFIMNLMVPFLEIILETIFNKAYNEMGNKADDAAFVRVSPPNDRSGTKIISVRQKEREDRERVKKLFLTLTKYSGRLALPTIYAIFCITFFFVGSFRE